jgi:hypothetical protein
MRPPSPESREGSNVSLHALTASSAATQQAPFNSCLIIFDMYELIPIFHCVFKSGATTPASLMLKKTFQSFFVAWLRSDAAIPKSKITCENTHFF